MFHIVQHKNIIRISCLAREDVILKMNLCLTFKLIFFSLFALYFQLKSDTPAAELCASGWIQRSLLLHMDQTVCREAGLQLPTVLTRLFDKLVLKKHTANDYRVVNAIKMTNRTSS